MRRQVKDKLQQIYRKLYPKVPSTAIKYHYLYNGVNINLYYDELNPSLSMVLSYEKTTTIHL